MSILELLENYGNTCCDEPKKENEFFICVGNEADLEFSRIERRIQSLYELMLTYQFCPERQTIKLVQDLKDKFDLLSIIEDANVLRLTHDILLTDYDKAYERVYRNFSNYKVNMEISNYTNFDKLITNLSYRFDFLKKYAVDEDVMRYLFIDISNMI